MLILKRLVFLSPLLFFLSCSSTQNTASKTMFPFTYQGEDYNIISIVVPEGEGINMLVYQKKDSVIFRTRDEDMDGRMDFVLSGDITLQEANKIYQYGIAQAISEDKFRTTDVLRTYVLTTENYLLKIQTTSFAGSSILNEFTISDLGGTPLATFLDWEANGILDDITQGEFDEKSAQGLYTLLLETGIEKNRIKTKKEQMIVKKQKS